MFEKELDRERKGLKSLISLSEPYVKIEAITATDSVHPAYRAYFEAEVAWWIHEERAIRTSNPRFDTASSRVRDLAQKLDAEFVKNARFDHEELSATIDAAVRTRLNFLCRPRTTLKWFVYRGEPTKPIQEVLLRLGFFYDYSYLTDGIRSWARSRSPNDSGSFEILSIIEFERIVEKVDNDGILDLSQDEFVSLLTPLYEFFSSAAPDIPPETVPTEAVIIFLDDKGAIPISQALERMLYREDLKYLTRSKFLDVIDEVIRGLESEDTLMRETEGSVAKPYGEGKAPDPFAADEYGASALDTEEHAMSIVDLRRLKFAEFVDGAQRERFTEKLFAGDSRVMEDVLQDVLSCSQWKDAMARLDRWYARNSIEPNSAPAMELAHALNRTYR
ncbi:MAG: hypothetical protein HYX66_04885 [Ignavibacteria bacterium]|nr:hypothetical protein [Ignavibacteria bacterium]